MTTACLGRERVAHSIAETSVASNPLSVDAKSARCDVSSNSMCRTAGRSHVAIEEEVWQRGRSPRTALDAERGIGRDEEDMHMVRTGFARSTTAFEDGVCKRDVEDAGARHSACILQRHTVTCVRYVRRAPKQSRLQHGEPISGMPDFRGIRC